jgi:hypothetical protein
MHGVAGPAAAKGFFKDINCMGASIIDYTTTASKPTATLSATTITTACLAVSHWL